MKFPKPKLCALLAFSGFVVALPLIAQEISEIEVVELSPFVVDTSSDSGYMAKNTLGGSRLNTPLKDTASPISVFTADLIEDLGAISVEDVMKYGTNITDSSAYEAATVNGNSLSEFDAVFYTRGLPGSRARNYFKWEISSDIFNVERIDQSRGPNSILFGVGSPGGIVNTSTKQAIINGSLLRAKITIGSENLIRGELDYNIALIEDKLALRFNAMYSDSNGWRPYEFDEQNRYHLAVKFRPTPSAELRLEVEFGEVSNIKNRPWPGIDSVTSWLDNGAQVRTGSAADASAGIGQIGANYVTYFEDLGSLMNMRRTLTSRANPATDFGIIQDPEFIAFDNGFAGPGASRDTDYATYSLFYTQKIAEGLNMEVAYNKQSTDFVSFDPQNAAQVIRGDPNAVLPDGTTSLAGQLYSEAVWENRNRDRDIDTLRASLSYEFDVGKLGRHRLAALYEMSEAATVRSENRLYLEGAPLNRSPENGNNLIRVRNHVPIGNPNGFAAGDWRDVLGKSYTHSDGNQYDIIWGQRNPNIDDDEESQESFTLAMQNYFFSDRLVTTFGYREDQVDILNRGTVRGAPVAPGKNGWWEVDYDNVTRPSFTAETTTVGLVGHLTDKVSVFVNKSENSGLPSFTQNVLPDSTTPEPSNGEGEDYGLHFDLMDGKFFASVSYYETAAAGLTAFGTRGAVESRNDRVLDAIAADGGLTGPEADELRVLTNVYTFDQAAEGYELDLTANFTDNWKVILNYANNELVQSNIAPEVEAWWADNRPLWDQNASLSTGNLTVAEEIEQLDLWLSGVQALEGIISQGSREHSFRMFTNYTFSDGVLNGFKLGGGVRYISESALGRDASNNVFFGNDQTLVDLVAGYSFPAFSDSVRVRLQLNVSNLFDEGSPYLTRANGAGVINRVNIPTPRNMRLSASFTF